MKAVADEAPVRDQLTLWDTPLVDPRKTWWKHETVLESHPDLPPPTGELPRRERRLPFQQSQYDPALWALARRYRDAYFLPRTLPEEYQELLRRARAAARAVQDAPRPIRDELLYRAEPLSDGDNLLLEERLLRLARTLETAGDDPDFDAAADCEPLIGVLEARAVEAFDMALREAETVAIVIIPELRLWVSPAEPRENLRVEFLPSRLERIVCDCGRKGPWLTIFIGRHAAIGCICGRLRWEDRITRESVEKADPGKLTLLHPPFDLDAIADGNGYGLFRHSW